jgi:hypothetical protein
MVGSDVVVDGDAWEVAGIDPLGIGVNVDVLGCDDAPDLLCCPGEATDALE